MARPEDALVEWRKERGLSQHAAGQMAMPPVSQAAWAAWESGRKPPGLHNAFEIERLTEGAIEASTWSKPHAAQRSKARKAGPRQIVAKAS